ncbi:beta-N-acetylhexosaminidase [Brevinema andersonii]|uniref:beta-N-acetylhexosaminidase n=1 Tax=Brevinema andersonii TaxID=34097 RepID=A0A1I1DIZ5_BREAD|nr:glycoside hydrolase family 3 N-terminal domain-containing protein [Brevinema andersonii]SFB74891.1 beta-N-acetylhexosaminidase [Brevinema andersonii]
MKKYLFFLLLTTCSFPKQHVFDNRWIDDYENIPLDFKIGQMLMLGFYGSDVNEEIRHYIEDLHIGGVVLFNRSNPQERANIISPDQVKKLNQELQDLAYVKLFISVDEEGGKVARLNSNNGFYTPPSPKELGEKNDTNITYHESRKIAEMLKKYGFNWNYVPTVDVDINAENPIIGKLGRAFSADPVVVADQAYAFVLGHQDEGIITSLKHFPGHGSSVEDSHEDLVDITKTYDKIELYPYEELIKKGYNETVLVGHLIDRRIDQKYPASLSQNFIQKMLRQDLGFQGVVITDDLNMGAINGQKLSLEEILVSVINAGVDIVMYANNLGPYYKDFADDAVSLVRKNVENGKISQDAIDQAYLRVMRLKKEKLY